MPSVPIGDGKKKPMSVFICPVGTYDLKMKYSTCKHSNIEFKIKFKSNHFFLRGGCGSLAGNRTKAAALRAP